jgi:uncharacterized protein YdaU (DUF1376 family)
MHYYKFNISDWHLATSHLSLEEEAVYFKLINFYYDTERQIPLETQTVIRRLRLGNYTAMVETVLHEFFIKQENGWSHNRCDDEIEKYHHKAETNKKIGKLGGRPKKINDLKNNPQITQSVSKDNPQRTLTTNHKPLTTNHNKNTIAKPEGLADLLWKDFLILRKSKKLPVTQTAIDGIAREAKKANKSLADVIQICCERGWGGFKAEWLVIESLKTQDKPMQKWDSTLEGVMAKGKELGILPKPGETEGQYRERVRSGHK